MHGLEILSVNISGPVAFEHTGPKVTGIFKKPVAHEVHVGRGGLAGDHVCDRKHHGSTDQAVYLYGQPDYDFWSRELGRPLEPGTFGENLTLADVETAALHVGDRLQLDELVLEVTAPRIPCRTFSARMKDAHFVKTFLAAGRPGAYCRVISPGPVWRGAKLKHLQFASPVFTIGEFNSNWSRKSFSPEDLRRYLATPLHENDRKNYQDKLNALAFKQ